MYVKAGMRMLDLLEMNHSQLLLLDHFGMDFAVGDRTVTQLCQQYQIPEALFLTIANLYNGHQPTSEDLDHIPDIEPIIAFLKSSHRFYKNDKYPEIKNYLARLHDAQPSKEIDLLEQFFDDYFDEVVEHLNYEDEVAFPYFHSLIKEENSIRDSGYSAREYQEHHSDIETKLADLKNLLLKHIQIEGNLVTRRKILSSLFELELDLDIHSRIEEQILIPLVKATEKRLSEKNNRSQTYE